MSRPFQGLGPPAEAATNVLVVVLAELLGDEFTPELEEEWCQAYNLVADSMQRAALERP